MLNLWIFLQQVSFQSKLRCPIIALVSWSALEHFRWCVGLVPRSWQTWKRFKPWCNHFSSGFWGRGVELISNRTPAQRRETELTWQRLDISHSKCLQLRIMHHSRLSRTRSARSKLHKRLLPISISQQVSPVFFSRLSIALSDRWFRMYLARWGSVHI